VRALHERLAAVIRIDSLWLAVEPADMRADGERLLASVLQVFGSAQAHHGYLCANARTTASDRGLLNAMQGSNSHVKRVKCFIKVGSVWVGNGSVRKVNVFRHAGFVRMPNL
jgi:hypothetical protein